MFALISKDLCHFRPYFSNNFLEENNQSPLKLFNRHLPPLMTARMLITKSLHLMVQKLQLFYIFAFKQTTDRRVKNCMSPN